MTEDLIKKYQINFQNKLDKYLTVDKWPFTNNGDLTLFLYNWGPTEIDTLLLPDIEQGLINPNAQIDNGSETISILIYKNNVTFYQGDDPPSSIPLHDFKSIVLAWRNFLTTLPLNGNKN